MLFSPKKLLASYLSKSLAEFFCVDPECVETNLVHDAKVVLNEIEIKQRRLGGLLVSGSVNQIEFAWTWSATSFITDATLTIKGVSIHVNIVEESDDDGKNNFKKETTSPIFTSSNDIEVEGESAPAPDWKAKYLQQIIDHLTLLVTDVTVSIHLDETSKVVLQGANVELRTLQNPVNDNENILLQSVSLASIEAWMETDDASKHPILEPFGYQAKVQRTSGSRFLDGILSGLFVQGGSCCDVDSSHACSSVRVHAGILQISGLNRLQQVLLSVGLQDTTLATDSNSTEHETPLLDGVKNRDNNIVPSGMKISSVFHLPFESMEVVLENDTTLRLARCSVRYCTDGTELSVDCTGGIWVDDNPLSQDNNRWILDLVSSEFVLDSPQHDPLQSVPPLPHRIDSDDDDEKYYNAQSSSISETSVETELMIPSAVNQSLRLDLSLEMFRKIYMGIQAILPQCEEAMTIAEEVIELRFQGTSSSSQSVPWTIRSNGLVSFRFTGSSDTWVEVSADFPRLTQGESGSNSPFSFNCLSTRIDSNAGFSIIIPQIRTENDTLVARDRVTATIKSMETLTTLRELWSQVTDIIGNQTSSGARNIPIDISLPGMDISMKEPTSSTVKMTSVRGSGIVWKLDLLQIEGVEDVSSEIHFLEATLDDDKTIILLQNITKLSYRNFDYLTSPVTETRLVLENDTVLLACKDVIVDYPAQTVGLQNEQTAAAPKNDLATFPLSFQFTAEHLLVKSNETFIDAKGIDIWVRPSVESSVDFEFNSIKGSIADRMELSCGMVQSSMKFHACDTDFDSSLPLVILPGLGKLSSATGTIHDIVDLSIAKVGHLAKPISVCTIVLDESMTTVKCDKIYFCCPDIDGMGTQNTGVTTTGTSFKLPFCFEVKRFILMPEYGPEKPAICFDDLQVNLLPHQETITVNASCTCVQVRGPDQAKLAVKGVRLDMCRNLTNDEDTTSSNLFGTQEFSLSMNEISSLHIPGVLSLSKPILNPKVLLQNDLLKVTCGFIHVSYIHPENQGIDDTTKNDRKVAELGFLSIPIRFAAQQVIIDSIATDTTSQRLQCDQLIVDYMTSSAATPKSVRMGCESLHVESCAGSCKMNGISISTTWKDGSDEGAAAEDDIFIPYLGSLSFVLVELQTCSEFNVVGKGRICRPLQNSTISYENGGLSADLEAVYLEASNLKDTTKSKDEDLVAAELTDFLNLPLELTAKCIVVVSNEDLEASVLSLTEINLTVKPPRYGIKGSMGIVCWSLRAINGSNSMGLVANGIKTEICLENFRSDTTKSISVPAFGVVSEAKISIASLSKIVIPGIGKIDREIVDTTVVLSKGCFKVNFGNVEWNCSSFNDKQPPSNSSSEMLIDRSTFNYPIEVAVQSLKVKDESSNALVCCEKLNISLRRDPFEESLRLAIQLGSFCGSAYEGASIAADGTSLTASISQVTTNETAVPELISIPGIGNISSAILSFSELSNLNVPNLAWLRKPARSLTIRFEEGAIAFDCPEICIQRSTIKRAPIDNSQPPYNLPCKINISIQAFQVNELLLHGKSEHEMECRSLNLALEPVFARVGSMRESPGAGVYFSCEDAKSIEDSTVINIPNLSASGLVQFEQPSKIGNLVVNIEKAQLAADFSSVNWSESLGKEPTIVMQLPFALVPQFELTLEYVGTLININNATIACEAFDGNCKTTFDSIGEHYIAVVKRRLPFLLVKTDLVGSNIGDGVCMMAGKYYMNTSVIGATIGVASRDAIGSALTQGKAARGVTSSEKYKFGKRLNLLYLQCVCVCVCVCILSHSPLFMCKSIVYSGDFSRGVASSVKSAAKSGAQMRGDDKYQVGDVTASTSKAVGEYTSKNRVRLAGAGGSSVGMIAGTVLLGPIGFVAGAFLGSSAGQRAMAAATGDPNKQEVKDSGESRRSVTSTNNSGTQHHVSSTQPVDLLSSSSHMRPTLAPAANVVAECVGTVASSDHRVVMVQAQLVDTPHTQNSSQDSMFVTGVPASHQSQQLVARSQNWNQDETSEYARQQITHGNHGSYQERGNSAQTHPTQHGMQTGGVPQRQTHTRGSYDNHANNTSPRPASTLSNSANSNSSYQQSRQQVDGREENSGYKFGDFTRSLFRKS